MVLQWALRDPRRRGGHRAACDGARPAAGRPSGKQRQLGRSAGGARREGRRPRRAGGSPPPISPPRPGPRGPYLHVLLLPWHSKLSNRHSAVLHSSSHWPFT